MAPLMRSMAACGSSDGSSLYTLSAMAVVADSTSTAGSQPRFPTAYAWKGCARADGVSADHRFARWQTSSVRLGWLNC